MLYIVKEKPEGQTHSYRSEPTLSDFVAFCRKHPELRFWQALRAWSEAEYIMYEKNGVLVDTFYWENKNE